MSEALRCDGCGRFVDAGMPTDGGRATPQVPLPAGWLRVFLVDRSEIRPGETPGDHADVCSRSCAAAWLNRETPESP